ncbi:unnamed protein product [Ectocarpus sp. 6 AP-2014]
MEQQTLSVAKAGLVCKLNARTTVFAVTNTKGTYDAAEDMTVNTAIGSPLLSRFDLVLLLLDTKNKQWDKVVSTFVLRAAIGPAAPPVSPKAVAAAKTAAVAPRGGSSGGGGSSSSSQPGKPAAGGPAGRGEEEPVSSKPWGTEKLQKYLCYVKDTFTSVRLSKDAEEVVGKYYQSQRSADNRSAARTTVRLLESLIRLAQAHARLMCRTEVTLQDAVVSVICVETSLHSTAQLGVDSVLHSDFPPNPDEEFELQQGLILDRLKLRSPPPPPFITRRGPGGSERSSGGSRSQSQRGGSNQEDPRGGGGPASSGGQSLQPSPSTEATVVRRDRWSGGGGPDDGVAVSHGSNSTTSSNGSAAAPLRGLPERGHPQHSREDTVREGGSQQWRRGGDGVATTGSAVDGPRGGGERGGFSTPARGVVVARAISGGTQRRRRLEREESGGGGGGGERERRFEGLDGVSRSRGGGDGRAASSSAGPDGEGGRWTGFSGETPGSSLKRRRQADDDGAGGAASGSGSSWGDVLLMSQLPGAPVD